MYLRGNSIGTDQTDRQTDRRTDRRTDRQTDRRTHFKSFHYIEGLFKKIVYIVIEEMIKLSSGVRRPYVQSSYLEILPSGTFFQEKNNPRRTTSHNLQNGQFCCRTRAPPSASFGNISAKNQATKPALKPNWAPGFDAYCYRASSPISPVRISTGIPSTGLCFFLSYHHHHGS